MYTSVACKDAHSWSTDPSKHAHAHKLPVSCGSKGAASWLGLRTFARPILPGLLRAALCGPHVPALGKILRSGLGNELADDLGF